MEAISEGTERKKENLRCYRGLIAYRELCQRIDLMDGKIRDLRATMYSARSPKMDGMPGRGGDRSSWQERIVEKVDERQRQLDALIEKEKEWYSFLIELLDGLTPDSSLILEMKYLDQAPWVAVSDALFGEPDEFDDGAEERAMKKAFRRHAKALSELEKIWPDDAPMEDKGEA